MRPTEPFRREHKALLEHIDHLPQAAREAADISDIDTLQELRYGLYALISVHFRKEEDLQLPAFDAAPDVAERVLARMGAATGDEHTH